MSLVRCECQLGNLMVMAEKDLLNFAEIVDMFKKHPVLLTSAIVAGTGFYMLKRYFAGGVCYSSALLQGKTVIITGANSGIGRETARDIAGRGARVILACRDLTKAERAAARIRKETGNENITVKLVDLASFNSIRKFCTDVLATEKRVDILINNAGIMACPQWKSEDGHELQFAVNHLGHFLLTNLLLDRIKAAEGGRIVNVSSLAHKKGQIHWDDVNLTDKYHPWRAYSQSKLANVLFTRELHNRLRETSTSAFSLHPGVVKTELARHLYLTVPKWKQVAYIPFIWFAFKTPRQGAQSTIYCAVQEGLEKDSGKYFSDCQVKEPAIAAQDDRSAARLWDLSAGLVGIEK